jgi:hypothetical protein
MGRRVGFERFLDFAQACGSAAKPSGRSKMSAATITKVLEAEERLAANLNEYVGEWVAIRDHVVVCHADTLRGLLAAIETQDIGRIDRILEVSDDPAVSCFF